MNYNLVPPNSTKAEAAALLYPGHIYDTALPQSWVDEALITERFDVRPHFVWGYPTGSLFGQPYPITQTGHDRLTQHLEHLGHSGRLA